MKKISIILIILFGLICQASPIKAQATELKQLALNIEKLAQFRQILSNMKKGYDILSGGYNTIKNISEGNFKLHKDFLDGLLGVSPVVRNYKRVSDIINYQLRLVKEYRSAYKGFQESDWFSTEEIGYMGKVYGNLFDLSVKNLDDLFTVITPGTLRMNDEERLAAIDKIYEDMEDKLMFLRHFNNSNSVLAIQRAKEAKNTKVLRKLYSVP
ncbi:MAG: TerB family tellurite resistance protein [Chryseobacterium sp.]|nr:MAG: TerB family tellurite resistance protein [Chryseobacterium sp.]